MVRRRTEPQLAKTQGESSAEIGNGSFGSSCRSEASPVDPMSPERLLPTAPARAAQSTSISERTCSAGVMEGAYVILSHHGTNGEQRSGRAIDAHGHGEHRPISQTRPARVAPDPIRVVWLTHPSGTILFAGDSSASRPSSSADLSPGGAVAFDRS